MIDLLSIQALSKVMNGRIQNFESRIERVRIIFYGYSLESGKVNNDANSHELFPFWKNSPPDPLSLRERGNYLPCNELSPLSEMGSPLELAQAG
jgi:hypothetical protein